MITDKLKQTLSHSGKFTTLSLAVTMAEKAIRILSEYGISTRTISFFAEGLTKMQKELEEGYIFIKEKEEFENIIKPLDKDNNADK